MRDTPLIPMGHRALVAYERSDGRYNLHFTHWGGANLRLVKQITQDRPFGGAVENHPWVEEVFQQLQTTTDPELPACSEAEQPQTPVDPAPVAVDTTLEKIELEYLDFQTYEAFYVVSRSFDVTGYRTLWLGFEDTADSVTNSPSVGHGILVALRWYDDNPVGDGFLRGWFAGAKTIIGESLNRGEITVTRATTRLLNSFQETIKPDRDYIVHRQDR
jgi:hypothetical protein